MNRRDPLILDGLAAEYVVGILRGGACAQFERMIDVDRQLQERVHRWESRLAPMALRVARAEPSDRVWKEIETRLFANGSGASSNGGVPGVNVWRRIALGFGALAASLVVALTLALANFESPQCYAVLTDSRNLPRLVVFDRGNMRELVVLPVGGGLAAAGLAPQLWLVTGANTLPLGRLNANDETRLSLDKPLSTALMADGARLIVTLEDESRPIGARPTAPAFSEGAVAMLGNPRSTASKLF